MAQNSLLLFIFIILSIIASSQVSSEVLSDGTSESLTLVDPRDSKVEENTCEDGEYQWLNGTCLDCLPHYAKCERGRQCCSVDNMSCWRYGNADPMCLCNTDYVWDTANGGCTYAPRVRFNIPLILGIVASFMLLLISVSLLAYLCRSCYKRRAEDKMHLIKGAI